MSMVCDNCGNKTDTVFPIDYDRGSTKYYCRDCFNEHHKLKIHKIDKEELKIEKPVIIKGCFESTDKLKNLYGNIKPDVDLINDVPYSMSKKGWYREQQEKIIEKLDIPSIGINGKIVKKDSQKERGGDKQE